MNPGNFKTNSNLEPKPKGPVTGKTGRPLKYFECQKYILANVQRIFIQYVMGSQNQKKKSLFRKAVQFAAEEFIKKNLDKPD
jgi:hypothetical protein